MQQIVCFGDSNTWGLIPDGHHERFSWGERWTSILQERLGNEEFHVIEEGLCGRTTVFHDEFRRGRCGVKALPMILESHYPIHIIVLMLGTNDCKTLFHASAEIIGKGIEKLLEVIRVYAKDSKVLLISPIHLGERVFEEGFDPEFDRRSVEESRRLKKVYEKIASQYGIDFLAASDYAVPSEIDMEHLNKEGHERIAKAIYEKIQNM
ncbi:MAG: arylesterase [Lachnospiraceae bacterium]|nr:arylesterase [Lachnospiraceae bacterium]